MRYTSVVLFLVLGCAAGCGTIDRRVDPDAEDPVGGAVLRSQDIGAMADKMARDIRQARILESTDPDHRVSFHITSLRNDSSDPIDRELVLTRIRTQLHQSLGRRVRILDRSAEGLDAVKAEIAAKRSGAVTANPNLRGALAGSDYALKGTIKDRSLQDRRLKSVYYVVTFELTDLETSELVWTNEYETKFVSEKSVISR
jgi:hypothetical protein